MLGLLLLYFIGKSYYKLAELYKKKNTWVYTILGIAVYYGGTFIGGIGLAIFYNLILMEDIESTNDFVLGIFVMPFGLLLCWGLYKYLEHNWKKNQTATQPDVLDGGLMH